MRPKHLLLAFVPVFLFFTMFGQENKVGVISGIVKDAKTKSPITEAVITLSSDAFEGQKFAVTDSAGVYKINNLPAGNYSIMFEMEGYQKYTRDNLTLKDGMFLALDHEMVEQGKSS